MLFSTLFQLFHLVLIHLCPRTACLCLAHLVLAHIPLVPAHFVLQVSPEVSL